MNELLIFNSPEFGEVRTVEIDGEPWLVGKDIAQALGYANPRDALVNRVDGEDKATVAIHDGRQNRNMTVINESGLYSLVLSSKLPKAKKFRRWVTSEVLPSIRKHGAYMTPETLEQMISSPDFGIKMLTALREERDKRRELEAQVEKDRPKVVFANAISSSKTSILVGDLAKLLNQNGIEIGQNRLFAWLRENKYLCSRGRRRNIPTQKSMEDGLFEIEENTTIGQDWDVKINVTPKVTATGQAYFLNLFLGECD